MKSRLRFRIRTLLAGATVLCIALAATKHSQWFIPMSGGEWYCDPTAIDSDGQGGAVVFWSGRQITADLRVSMLKHVDSADFSGNQADHLRLPLSGDRVNKIYALDAINQKWGIAQNRAVGVSVYLERDHLTIDTGGGRKAIELPVLPDGAQMRLLFAQELGSGVTWYGPGTSGPTSIASVVCELHEKSLVIAEVYLEVQYE
ncbi:hypothetical protein [Aeoliella sp. SH292]|uniref:hypothetical protein n=1 Tax=Aeoliella sp. SH292 TaxID=3454464 RepID=UPI003F988942